MSEPLVSVRHDQWFSVFDIQRPHLVSSTSAFSAVGCRFGQIYQRSQYWCRLSGLSLSWRRRHCLSATLGDISHSRVITDPTQWPITHPILSKWCSDNSVHYFCRLSIITDEKEKTNIRPIVCSNWRTEQSF